MLGRRFYWIKSVFVFFFVSFQGASPNKCPEVEEEEVVEEEGEKPLVGLEPIIPLEPIVPFKAPEEKKIKPRKKKVVVARKTRGELRAEEAAREEAKKNTKKPSPSPAIRSKTAPTSSTSMSMKACWTARRSW